MNKSSLIVIVATSLSLTLVACAGHHKTQHNQDVPPTGAKELPSDTKADLSAAKQTDDRSVITDKNLGEPDYANESSQDEVPMAEENTQAVGEDTNVDSKIDTTTSSTQSDWHNDASAATATANALKAAKNSKSKKSQQADSGVPADKALLWLEHGNVRFAKHHLRADGEGKKDRARTASSQKPHSTIFACADSRNSPELIFDQKLGEIFVVRTEGLSVDTAVIASLEKGVDGLGTHLLVVLSGCGADPAKVEDEIVSRSSLLAEKVNTGDLKIVPATYDLKTGIVKFE